MSKITSEDLNFLVTHGIIDMPDIQSIIDMEKKKELIEKHPYKAWQGKDGNWYVYLPDKERGRILKKRTTQTSIENVIVAYQKEQIENPTIEEVFTEWNDYRCELKKIAKSSHTRMRQTFNRHFKEFGKKRVKNVTEEQWIEFLERQIPEYNLTAKSFASLKTIVRGILKRAKRKKYISFNADSIFSDLDVSDKEFFKSIKEDYEEVFDENETASMINYLKENCDIRNAGILLLFVTGMRIGELATLQHEDLNPETNTIKIRRTETRYEENGTTVYEIKDYPKTQSGVREIVVPTSYQWLVRDLYAHSSTGDFIFKEKGERLTTYHLRKREYYVCKQTGVYKKSPHKIRATYDSILLDANVDRRMVKDQMGHSEIKTSENNYHRNRKSFDRKQQILDAIPEFNNV